MSHQPDQEHEAEREANPQTWLVDISRERCDQLLAENTLGRLAVIVDGRPEIFPVTYVYDELIGSVIFPSNAGTKLTGALEWPSVAFEIDGLDADEGGGWSVVVTGHARELTDRSEIKRLSDLRHVLWRSGPAMHWIWIDEVKVTGRRISVGPG